MTKREQLNRYIQQLQARLRLEAGLRGAAVLAGVALLATIALALALNHYAFPERGVNPAPLSLLLVLMAAAGIWPGMAVAAPRPGSHRGQGGGRISGVSATPGDLLGVR